MGRLPIQDQPLAQVMRERYQVHADLVEAFAARDSDEVARLNHEHSLHRITVAELAASTICSAGIRLPRAERQRLSRSLVP
ncbi:hypothetical protein ACTXG6_19905 [Pseudonocardia sp. Cha107L01]|jgi:hypothetical protein|uniref:hypothetical protein n=1 Tax=Pseudonocardia sp. Cha107L01 TaxID=3457576 RepID=UPI00403E5142